MLINIEVNNNVEIRSLNDLFIWGRLQEVGSIKVNNQKSQENMVLDDVRLYSICTHSDSKMSTKYTKKIWNIK